jgi:serine phosphatase RsbU (regulator of sigma subunit)
MLMTVNALATDKLVGLLAHLSGELRLEVLIHLITSQTASLTGAVYAGMLEGKPGSWQLLGEYGGQDSPVNESLEIEHIGISPRLPNLAAQKKSVCWHHDLSGRLPSFVLPLANSAVGVPLMRGDQVLALLYLEYAELPPSEVAQWLGQLAPCLANFIFNSLEFKKLNTNITERAEELSRQKELVLDAHQNVKLLSEVGKDIASKLEIKDIVQTVYANINILMDASVFDIGVANEAMQRLEFHDTIENGEKLGYNYLDLADKNSLAVICYKNEREILINDLNADFNHYIPNIPVPQQTLGQRPEALIYLPIFSKSKTLGVVTVQSFQKEAYTKYQVDVLRNLAVYIGIALENASLYQDLEHQVQVRTSEVIQQKEELEASHEQLERSFQNIKLLNEIGLEITAELTLDKIIEKTYNNVNALMDASAFAIGIVDEARTQIEFRGGIENGSQIPTFAHLLSDPLRFSVWSLKHRREVFINDYEAEYNQYIAEMPAPVMGENPRSLIYIPLISKEKVIGVITVQSFRPKSYTAQHLTILRNLALLATVAIENAAAYQKIESQHENIRKSNEKITASINYARRIQSAMLPDRVAMQRALPDSLIFFRPRDIVSGDFYWFLEKDGKTFIAAVDCTGHGVPGAFMSMIGNEFMNEIVTLRNIESPELILAELHRNVRKALKQAESDNRDGMDVSICVIDPTTKVLEFAGAKSPLLYLRENDAGVMEIHHLKGDKNPIGGLQKEAERVFTKHTIPLDKTTAFYIFTDGFQDQFGGPEGRKFSIGQIKDLFLANHKMPMDRQRGLLRNTLTEWMGNEKQIDDILLLGFRL